MILAENQEFDVLELVGNGKEKGEQNCIRKNTDQTVERMITAGCFTNEQISISIDKN